MPDIHQLNQGVNRIPRNYSSTHDGTWQLSDVLSTERPAMPPLPVLAEKRSLSARYYAPASCPSLLSRTFRFGLDSKVRESISQHLFHVFQQMPEFPVQVIVNMLNILTSTFLSVLFFKHPPELKNSRYVMPFTLMSFSINPLVNMSIFFPCSFEAVLDVLINGWHVFLLTFFVYRRSSRTVQKEARQELKGSRPIRS